MDNELPAKAFLAFFFLLVFYYVLLSMRHVLNMLTIGGPRRCWLRTR